MFPPVTLAIDYGTKRMGFAISKATLSEPLHVLVIPFQAIGTDLSSQAYQFVVAHIKDLIQMHGVQQLVVGLSESVMAQSSKVFGNAVERELHIPVFFHDETLSSQEVIKKLQGYRHRKKDEAIDHYAAAEILERFLDYHN